MYIFIKTIDGKKKVALTVSKTLFVKDLRLQIEESFGTCPEKQRLFYRGKQLEDEYNLHDYNINQNDVIQLMVKPDLVPSPPSTTNQDAKQNANFLCNSCPELVETEVSETAGYIAKDKPVGNLNVDVDDFAKNKYFRVGDFVHWRDAVHGAWFEGKIADIKQAVVNGSLSQGEPSTSEPVATKQLVDNLVYTVEYKSFGEDKVESVGLGDIRPRALQTIELVTLKPGDIVLANYNVDEPDERGYWYDFMVGDISELKTRRKEKHVDGFLFIGADVKMNVKIKFLEFKNIEQPKLLADRSEDEEHSMTTAVESSSPSVDPSTLTGTQCEHCRDNPRRKCKECSCHVCGGKNDPDKQLMCDECNLAYHIWCLSPPLQNIPDDDDWYCSECKNDENEIVKAGEKLKESKKKMKMASANCSRDWGKGMACVGRTKECTIVRKNHFGPIPGIEVGTTWKYRLQVSECGVHRPHVAGIHGRETDGAYSLVLSGGYEDDIDNGDEFMYTGSGGRDLSGNKRTAQQSCDQTLTRMNRALALNCGARLDAIKGAEAKNWKDGKPVRVVRNFKLAKHSEYAPEDGNRYDGIYKVFKYFQQTGKSGFKVWRYVLRRDDPTPSPWSKKGKAHIAALGLEMQYPEGYMEAQALTAKKKDSKRVLSESSEQQSMSPPAKRAKKAFTLDVKTKALINADEVNAKLWDACRAVLDEGQQKFISAVEEAFMCICCQELVHKPITTTCNHNMCKVCLNRSFSAEVFNCPCCRNELGKKYEMKPNEKLQAALLQLFPGYNIGR